MLLLEMAALQRLHHWWMADEISGIEGVGNAVAARAMQLYQ
jgi:hypothetical protein